MKKIGHLKTYKMKLTTLSPVFVGGGEKLSKLDYFFDFNNKTLNIIDEAKFSKYLIQNNLIDNFTNFVSKEKNASLFEWAKKQSLNIVNLDIYKNKYKYSKEDLKALNDVNLFIKNHNGQPYIPGSSIKGAIRTAILLKKLSKHPEIKNKYKSQIESCLNSGNKKELNKIEKLLETDLICLDIEEYKKIQE